MQMILFSYLLMGAFAVYLLLGFYAYQLEPKAKINRMFLLLCYSLALWSSADSLEYLSKNSADFWMMDHIAALGWCSVSAIFLHLILILTKSTVLSGGRWKVVLLYSPVVIMLAAEVFIAPGLAVDQSGSNFLAWLERAYYLGYGLATIVTLGLWQKRATLKREKKQAKIIFVSSAVTLALTSMADIFLRVEVLPGLSTDFSPIIIFIVTFGIWYAINNYEFLRLTALIKAEDIVNKVTDVIIVVDVFGVIAKVNTRFEKLTGYDQTEVVGKEIGGLFTSLDWGQCTGGDTTARELQMLTSAGNDIPFSFVISFIYDKTKVVDGLIFVGQDMRLVQNLQSEIDERKQKEAKLRYISMHDSLTGMYNRSYFERALKKMDSEGKSPIGVIVCDVDGLKLVNDTFGHSEGDILLMAAAEVISKAAGENGTVARIGGDEFVILFSEFDESYIKSVEEYFEQTVAEYNSGGTLFPLSISVGSSVSYGADKSVVEVFKEADNNMYRVKLNRTQSARNGMVQAMMRTLEARDFITEGHVDRLQKLVVDLGRNAGLSPQETSDLRLLAQFHDIGKVGIPDNVLFKLDALDQEERKIMERHSEIGYRIAQSIHELIPISKFILLHHERWDGSGYPLGIGAEEIPLECRILAIVDAYDAMTNDRPYRKAMPNDAALTELNRNAGTQFDPGLVDDFVQIMQTRPELRQVV